VWVANTIVDSRNLALFHDKYKQGGKADFRTISHFRLVMKDAIEDIFLSGHS